MSDYIYLKPLKTLEQHNRERTALTPTYPRPNGIACPKCRSEMHDKSSHILLSNPPQKAVICLECGHTGYALA